MVRLKGFQKLTRVDEALRIFLQAVEFRKLKSSLVHVGSSLNRVISEDIFADADLPAFDKSAVDGFAVRAGDVAGASQSKPKTLHILQGDRIIRGNSKRVWTGNAIPAGSDAVVMLEDAKESDERVEIWNPVSPGENVSPKGEDLRKGDIAIKRGIWLRPQHLGLLSAMGCENVRVTERPKVGIIATGNELVEVGNELRRGQIYESNRLVLGSLCANSGATGVDLGLVGDDPEKIREKLKSALENCDLVLTTGGTSVGVSDLVPDVVNSLGHPGILVHGVAMRPGMPTALGVVDGKPIVVLPGNPVAAMIGFDVFAKPIIDRFSGHSSDSQCVVQAKMCSRVATTLGRRNFVRVRVVIRGGELWAEPISVRGSGLISTMTKSNAFVIVPENREGVEKGEVVSAQLFDDIRQED